MKYGERLKIARDRKGWSQEELADATNGLVKQGTISKIERGGQGNSAYDIILAYVLDINPKWLYDGDIRFQPEWLENEPNHNQVNEKNDDYWHLIYKSRALKPDEANLLTLYNRLTPPQKHYFSNEFKRVAEENQNNFNDLKQIFENR